MVAYFTGLLLITSLSNCSPTSCMAYDFSWVCTVIGNTVLIACRSGDVLKILSELPCSMSNATNGEATDLNI